MGCSSNFANKVYLKSKEIIQNFTFLKFTFEKVTSTYNENDIVIVTKDRYLSDEAEKDGILHMFGSVNSLSNNENICLNTFLNLASQTDIFKGISRINHLKTSLEINSYWFLLRICNFSTISREYAALWNIFDSKFIEIIIRANHFNTHYKIGQRILPSPMRYIIASQYNPEQMKAVTSGLKGSPFILVQGPPGTGKTSTIIGLISIAMYFITTTTDNTKTLMKTFDLKLNSFRKKIIEEVRQFSPLFHNNSKKIRKFTQGKLFGLKNSSTILSIGNESNLSTH